MSIILALMLSLLALLTAFMLLWLALFTDRLIKAIKDQNWNRVSAMISDWDKPRWRRMR